MKTPPTSERIRLTISVTPEVHAAFARLAKAGNESIGRTMGDWLADTVEAADFMAGKMEEAREAPKKVMREMHAYALGLVDETSAVLDGMRGAAGSRKRSAAPVAPFSPPPSNTGGKVPQTRAKGSKP
jgi:hypothetical protein